VSADQNHVGRIEQRRQATDHETGRRGAAGGPRDSTVASGGREEDGRGRS